MQNYEMVLVVHPEIPEEDLSEALGRVWQAITERGGSIEGEERWGRRRLAYPIKRQREGTYVLSRFTLAPERTKEVEASLRLDEKVLRHMIVKLEEKAGT